MFVELHVKMGFAPLGATLDIPPPGERSRRGMSRFYKHVAPNGARTANRGFPVAPELSGPRRHPT
jgi:hypothetical protein